MHLLICDDDARFAARVEQKVRDELAQRGIPAQITVCTRGEEALAIPHLELYQVALLDVDLDTMNGISLGRQLRQSSPDIALIYISAYLEFAPEGYTVNAFRYIRQISGYKVTLRNGVELSVSRNGYAAIRATYLEWKGQFSDES